MKNNWKFQQYNYMRIAAATQTGNISKNKKSGVNYLWRVFSWTAAGHDEKQERPESAESKGDGQQDQEQATAAVDGQYTTI